MILYSPQLPSHAPHHRLDDTQVDLFYLLLDSTSQMIMTSGLPATLVYLGSQYGPEVLNRPRLRDVLWVRLLWDERYLVLS